MWWPQIDNDLEKLVKNCDDCQSTRHLPPVAPLQPWEWPQRPWARVHVDYARPFMNKYFLLLVDAHSKWIEVRPVNNATSTVTIDQLRSIFATHGLPVPDMNSKVQMKQQTQKFNHDQRARSRTLQVGDTVNVRNFPVSLRK